jgi:transposase
LLSWSESFAERPLWALEDCRQVTRALERRLQDQRERLVRVPPRLTAPQRRRSRTRGKSDLIDALAIARAALREPGLDSPRPQNWMPACRCRSVCSTVPCGSTGSHGSSRAAQTTQVQIARDLVARCRSLTRDVLALERELHARTTALAPRLLQLPGCGPF